MFCPPRFAERGRGRAGLYGVRSEKIRSKMEEKGNGKIIKRDSVLFKPLVRVAEKYLRDYCDGRQADDEKAKVALRVLSVYRRILKLEKEREEIKSEWEKLIAGVAELKRLTKRSSKTKTEEELNPVRNDGAF